MGRLRLRSWALGALIVVQGLLLMSCSSSGAMAVEEVDPPFGNIAGSDDIVIVGKGFKPGLTVHFNKRPAKHVVLESDSKIRVKTPPGPEGKVDVIVTDAGGKTLMLKDGFTYRKES